MIPQWLQERAYNDIHGITTDRRVVACVCYCDNYPHFVEYTITNSSHSHSLIPELRNQTSTQISNLPPNEGDSIQYRFHIEILRNVGILLIPLVI